MRTRENRVVCRLDDEELERFDEKVAKCGLTRQTYLRHLIRGYVPRAAPTKVFHDTMSALARIGNNLNQIAARANSTGVIDADAYERDASELRQLMMTLTEAVISPQPISEASITLPTVDRSAKLIADIEVVIEKYKRDAAEPAPAIEASETDTESEPGTLYDELFGEDTF